MNIGYLGKWLALAIIGIAVAAQAAPGEREKAKARTKIARKATPAKKMAARAGAATAAEIPKDPEALIRFLQDYKEGETPIALPQCERALQAACGNDAESRAGLAAKLADALQGPATPEAKKFFCRQLGIFGTAREVPALAALIGDKDLGDAALAGLERIPGPEAAAALRTALAPSEGRTRIGLMNALGNRGDGEACMEIAKSLLDADLTVASAAADALGKIDDPEALRVLRQAAESDREIPEGLIPSLGGAALRHAERAEAGGDNESAAQIYEGIFKRTQNLEAAGAAPLRRAALIGILRVEPDQTGTRALQALRSGETGLQQAALEFVKTGRDISTIMENIAGRSMLEPKIRAALLTALAGRGEKAVLAAALEDAGDGSAVVRQAALDAVGRLGGPAEVAPLAAMMAGKNKEALAPVHATLVALRGDEVNRELLAQMSQGSGAVSQDLLQVLIDRDARDAAPELLKLAGGEDAAMCAAAIRGVGALGGLDHVPAIIALLGKSPDAGRRAALASALAEICRRAENRSAAAEQVVKQYENAPPPVQAALLGALGAIGDARGLAVIEQAAKSPNPELHAEAIRALGAWPDGKPAERLVQLAAAERDPRLRALALRGFAGLLDKPADLAPDRKLELIGQALAIEAPAAEKKSLLGSLGKIVSPRALEMAQALLGDPEVADEAALAAIQIAEAVQARKPQQATAAMKQVIEKTGNETIRAQAKALLESGTPLAEHKGPNLALGAKAESTDGLAKDGRADGPQAAIDGKPDSYWDEQDGQKLYSLKVTLPAPAEIAVLRILGYQQNSYSPKDFEVLCDGKPAATVRGAVYRNGVTEVMLPGVKCQTVELKITGYTGKSPAIRELMIYGPEK